MLTASAAAWAWFGGSGGIAPKETRIGQWRVYQVAAPERGEKAAGVRLADVRLELAADQVENADGQELPKPASRGRLLFECAARADGSNPKAYQRVYLDRPVGVAQASCAKQGPENVGCLAGSRHVLMVGTATQIFSSRVRWLFRGEPYALDGAAPTDTVRLGVRFLDVNRERRQVEAVTQGIRETVLLADQKSESFHVAVFPERPPTREMIAAEARRLGSEWKVNQDQMMLSHSVSGEPVLGYRFPVAGAARAFDEFERRCGEARNENQERFAKIEQYERQQHKLAAIKANEDRDREIADLKRRGCRPIGATIVCPP